MKVSFAGDELRDCCCLFQRGEEAYGVHLARIVFNMIADAEAAENAEEWHQILVDDLLECGPDGFQVAVGIDYVARFVPAGRKFEVGDGGRTKWSSVTRLKLIDIWRPD